MSIMDRRTFIKQLPIGIWAANEYLSGSINDIAAGIVGTPETSSEKHYLVLIHPGHVKNDPGCEQKGVGIEYILTAHIAEYLKQELASQNVGVLMTRDENDFSAELKKYKHDNRGKFGSRKIDTYTMIKWAEDSAVDAMLSIHINDVPAKNRPFNTGFAVISSSKNGALKKSRQLARIVLDSVGEQFPPSNNRNEASYVRENGNLVLLPGYMNSQFYFLGNSEFSHKIPAILVECGYISQKYKASDGRELTIGDPEIQKLYAQKIAKGITSYLAEDKKSKPQGIIQP